MTRHPWLSRTILAALAAMLLASCGDSTKPAVPNRRPEILEVRANPASVVLGSQSRVFVREQDPDGDALTYRWTALAGAFADSGAASTSWTAPDAAGSFWLKVAVSDDEFTVIDSALILVGEGSIAVTSDPAGANISLDGSITEFVTPHTFDRVAIGAHRVTISSTEFAYSNTFADVNVPHGGSETVGFAHRVAVAQTLPLGRTDFTSLGTVTFLVSGTGFLYTGTTTNDGPGLYSSAVTPVAGAANGVHLTGNILVNEPIVVTPDGNWIVYTNFGGDLVAARLINTDGNGVVESIVPGEPMITNAWGAAYSSGSRQIAWSKTESADAPAVPLFWGSLSEANTNDPPEIEGSRIATSTFGRRPSWDPQGFQMIYELGGLMLRAFPPETGVPGSPDTLATPDGFNQLAKWGPWGARHVAYINGPDELNAIQIVLQVPTSNRYVVAYTQLFDPRGMAWSPVLPQLLVCNNLPQNPQMLLLSNLPIPTGAGPAGPATRSFGLW